MIRLAKLSEIEEIITITKACTAKMISENIYQWDQYYPNYQAFEKDVERGELYVLTTGFSNDDTKEQLMGCITISSEKDAEYDAIDWLTEDGLQYYIHRLAIHPSFQYKGYAKLLMDFAEIFSKKQGVISVRLDTFSANERNQRFYKNRGYQKLGDIYFPRQSDLCFHCYELILK
ncbi:MAG: GNAT family N-acetyltransferase [Flavobacteriaceae bacterium]|nr:GNAT family N-acetyltransferase [Flavobacteriaceae bacterium]